MKRYSPNAKVPMKFHNLYVKFLNPLGILILLAMAVLVLLTALNITVLPQVQSRIDGDGSSAAQIMLWLMFGVLVLAFLFAVFAETLLAKRRTLGVIILILGYLLNTASAAFTAYNERSVSNFVALGVTLVISILVCVYYWKRGRLFH
ncbi:MAG TPA: hypothetical protein PLP25_01250 [Candidatus Limiplasma sp.]|nr:hypothetical protein [Candidatus Limiplasma sp.]HPS80470.1 hypothetical protein [Candidatus Limiplasma sp.]